VDEKAQLAEALRTAGLSAAEVGEFLAHYETGRRRESRVVLTGYRARLLADIHAGEDRVDLVDYILSRWVSA